MFLQTTNMKRITLLSLAAASFIAVMSACSPSSARTSEENPTNEQMPVMETFHLRKDKFSTSMQIPGELLAYQQVDLYAKVTGFVKELRADIGTEVHEGQLLAVLEAPELLSQLSASESRLRSQEAVVAASSANYDRLVETSKTPGTVSQNDLDLALAKRNSDLANLEAARASAKETSSIRSYLEIRAPFSGIITSRNVNPGAYVGPSGKGSEFPLFTLQQQNQLRLAVSVPEAFTGFLKEEDEVSFKVRSQPAETFKAKIKRMAGALDLRLRSEKIEMDVTNNDKKLLPGMVAEVRISLTAKDSSFTIPKSALINSNEGLFVIRMAGGKAQRVEVKKGRDINERYEVFGNLSTSDILILKGSEEIKDGAQINTKIH